MGITGLKDLRYAFSGCAEFLNEFRGGYTDSVTTMAGAFQSTISINPEIAHWDVGAVTDSTEYVPNTLAANPDVSAWDTSRVTNLTAMFKNAQLGRID